MKKLIILVLLFTSIILKAQNEHSPLGVNIGGVEAWVSNWIFVNIANQSYGWFPAGQKPTESSMLTDNDLTSDRYIKQGESGILAIVWDAPEDINGDFVLTYTGDYTVSISNYWTSMTPTLIEPGRMEATANNTRFIFIDFSANSSNSALSNIRFTKKDDENLSQTYNPNFLKDIEKFKVLRFMDLMQTNNSTITSVDEYTTENSLIQRPVSIEKLIELANTLNANPWFTLPFLANDNLIDLWAQIIRSNLNKDLTAKIELSNEVWNSQFTQHQQAADKARELGLSNTGNNWEDAPVYYGYRSAQIHSAFKNKFASHTLKPGLCNLVSWQAAFKYHFINSVLPAYKDEEGAGEVPDAIAIAPYFGVYLGSPKNAPTVKNWTIDQLFEEIFHGSYILGSSAIDQAISWTSDYTSSLDEEGINELICYEAGQHLVGFSGMENDKDLTSLFTEANRSPQMKNAYLEYLRKLNEIECGTVCLFNSHGRYSKWGSWGMKEYVGQDINTSPKSQAVIDFIDNIFATWEAGKCSYSSISNSKTVDDSVSISQTDSQVKSISHSDKSESSSDTILKKQ